MSKGVNVSTTGLPNRFQCCTVNITNYTIHKSEYSLAVIKPDGNGLWWGEDEFYYKGCRCDKKYLYSETYKPEIHIYHSTFRKFGFNSFMYLPEHLEKEAIEHFKTALTEVTTNLLQDVQQEYKKQQNNLYMLLDNITEGTYFETN